MQLDSLKEAVDDIAYEEFLDWKLPLDDVALYDSPESRLQQLGKGITPRELDVLEKEDGYVIWSLRLSLYVENDDRKARARRFLNHPYYEIRELALDVLKDRYFPLGGR